MVVGGKQVASQFNPIDMFMRLEDQEFDTPFLHLIIRTRYRRIYGLLKRQKDLEDINTINKEISFKYRLTPLPFWLIFFQSSVFHWSLATLCAINGLDFYLVNIFMRQRNTSHIKDPTMFTTKNENNKFDQIEWDYFLLHLKSSRGQGQPVWFLTKQYSILTLEKQLSSFFFVWTRSFEGTTQPASAAYAFTNIARNKQLLCKCWRCCW